MKPLTASSSSSLLSMHDKRKIYRSRLILFFLIAYLLFSLRVRLVCHRVIQKNTSNVSMISTHSRKSLFFYALRVLIIIMIFAIIPTQLLSAVKMQFVIMKKRKRVEMIMTRMLLLLPFESICYTHIMQTLIYHGMQYVYSFWAYSSHFSCIY